MSHCFLAAWPLRKSGSRRCGNRSRLWPARKCSFFNHAGEPAYFSFSAIFAMPAFAQASSFSPRERR